MGSCRITYVLGGLRGVNARAVEQKAHGVGLQRLARAERVEDLAGSRAIIKSEDVEGVIGVSDVMRSSGWEP